MFRTTKIKPVTLNTQLSTWISASSSSQLQMAGSEQNIYIGLRSNPHRTRAHKFERKSFDVACVHCGYSHSRTQVVFALRCACASCVDEAMSNATQRKQMGPVVINGRVHTARKEDQRKNVACGSHCASCVN